MSRLLVTGYPGWLSAALIDQFTREPWPGVTALRLLTLPDSLGGTVAAPKCAVPVELRAGSLADRASLAGAARDCELVLHAAGVIHVRRTRDWYDVNACGTSHLLDECRASGSVRRFVYVSTNAAAGRSDASDRPLDETAPPRPLSHYGRSKLMGETETLARRADFETVVLRPCMFYGPPIPPRHVDVYRRVQRGLMPLIGDGSAARSLAHVGNVLEACRLALSSPRAPGQTYFVADAEVYTVRQIIDAMGVALGRRVRYVPLPRLASRAAYVADRALAGAGLYSRDLHLFGEGDWNVGVSIAKASRELGYSPRFSLDVGMRDSIAWCRRSGLLD